MVPVKSMYFVSGSKRLDKEKNTEVCMASFLSINGCISAYFDNICLKLSTDAYFEVSFRSKLSKWENSKHIFQ